MAERASLKAWLAISVFFALLGGSTSPAGRTIYVDDDAAGADNGSSWADAYNYLQDALAAATSGDEIRVAEGTYRPDEGVGITAGDREAAFGLINGVTIKGGYGGLGAPEPNARDIGLYESILSGDLAGDDVEVGNTEDLLTEPTRAENSYHLVFAGYWTDATAVLDGFTITGGNADGASGTYPNNCGAGMFNHHDSSPRLKNCKFSGNSAFWMGGAIHNKGGPTLINCVLTGNSAEYGGGISTAHSEGLTTVVNCIISSNIASTEGGGMRSWESDAIVANSKITENSAHDRGGGIYMDENSNMALTGCTVSRNKAVGREGGGLYSRWYSYPVITNCIFWENSDIGGVDESAQISGSDQIDYSCVQGWTGLLGGTGNMGEDPLLVDPNNDDYHLQLDSPCIDAGDNNGVAADITDLDGDGDVNEPVPLDLDGNPRVVDGDGDGVAVVDMGAYEVAPPYVSCCFGVNHLKMAQKGKDVDIKGTFKPIVPVDLTADDVTYFIDDGEGNVLEVFIPAGSFEGDGKAETQRFKYDSPKSSKPEIRAKFDFGKCRFELKAKKITSADKINSTALGVALYVGNNVGEEALEVQAKKKHLEYKRRRKVDCCRE